MDIQTSIDPQAVAHVAAEHATRTLSSAIANHGSAVWVLAGGSTPNLAYEIIASSRLGDVAWSAVTIIIGDERIGPLDGPDNNWHTIKQLLLDFIPEATLLRPQSDRDAETAAADYAKQLDTLPKAENGLPRFDLVWLGMGEDGHTLSLFPGHDSLMPTDSLVIPVYNSPKPPSDRISLSLAGLGGTQSCVILACGQGKQSALAKVTQAELLPILQAANVVVANGGKVLWLVDEAATPRPSTHTSF